MAGKKIFIKTILLTLCFVLNTYSMVYSYTDKFYTVIANKIYKFSRQYDISSDILIAIMWQESKINPYAVNLNGRTLFFNSMDKAINYLKDHHVKKFDVGLMQINSWWIRKLNISLSDAFDININIELGTLILKQCMDRYPDSYLSCYHTGRITKKGMQYQKKIISILSFLTQNN